MTAYFLSEKDRAITREVAEKVRRGFLGRGGTGKGYNPHTEDVQNQAPDVYIARTPPGGISGLSIANASDTGTSTDSLNSVYSAECTIWRISQYDNGADLEPLEDFYQRVYNIHEHAIPGNLFTLIARTKEGSWIALPFFCCGSSDDGFGTDTGTGTGTGTGSGTGSVDGGTNTGTGTGTNNACAAISLTERDVQCESGQLNIYSRTIYLDIIDGCLTKTTGAWAYERTEGVCGTVTITFTNINDFIDYIENVFYYNTYDSRLCVNIGGFWYCWCPCYEDTGTGTSGMTPGTGGGGGCCDAGTVTVQVTNKTGLCSCWPSSFTLSSVGSSGFGGTNDYLDTPVICGVGQTIRFVCSATAGSSRLMIAGCGVDVTADSAGHSCNPINATFTSVSLTLCCSGGSGSATFTVVE